MTIQLDTLVRGKAGKSDKEIEGRVYAVKPTFVAIIKSDSEEEQGIIYNPEVVGPPRPVIQRTNIPRRFR